MVIFKEFEHIVHLNNLFRVKFPNFTDELGDKLARTNKLRGTNTPFAKFCAKNLKWDTAAPLDRSVLTRLNLTGTKIVAFVNQRHLSKPGFQRSEK